MVLTGAAQALLPQTQQHALTHVAVHGLVEMFHPPQVLPVFLSHLLSDKFTETQRHKKKQKTETSTYFQFKSAWFLCNLKTERVIAVRMNHQL